MLPVKRLALALLASSALGLAAAQGSGMLLAGQNLPQVMLRVHTACPLLMSRLDSLQLNILAWFCSAAKGLQCLWAVLFSC